MPPAGRGGGQRRRAVLLLALSVCLTGASGWFFVRSLRTPDTGLIRYDPEVVAGIGGVLFLPSSPFTAPLSAGLVPGRDLITALDSQPVGGTRDLVRAALGVRGFGPYLLEVRRDGGALRTVAVTPYLRPARAEWFFELVFCLMLAAAAFALWRRFPDAPFTIPLALSMLLSLLFTCIMPFSFESLAANIMANAGNISSWLLVIFAMYFPGRRGSRAARWMVVGGVISLYAAFCVLRAILYSQWMATGLESTFTAYRQLGRLVIFSDGAAYAVLAGLLGMAYARSRLPRDRRMLQWMLAGVLIAFPPYFFLDQLPVVLGGPVHNVGLGSVAQLFLSVLPLFLLLALTSRTAPTPRVFLARGGAWGALLVLTVAAFGVAYLPLAGSLASAYRIVSPLPEMLAAAILVAGLAIVRYVLERLFSRARAPSVGGLEGIISLTERRSGGTRELAEVRSVIHGIVRTLRDPVKVLAESAARGGTARQKEAGAEAELFLERLSSLCASASSRGGFSSASELAGAAAARAQEKFTGVRFELHGESRQPFACHAEEVTEAIGMIIDNAAEASPSGAAVQIRCSSEPARAIIEVCDAGPGLDGEARRKLFKPFSTTKPGHRGLGLYFARIVLERSEGGIVFDHGPSGGACARISFPLAAENLMQNSMEDLT
jgi:signal transduction histidine kinase